MLTAIICCKL